MNATIAAVIAERTAKGKSVVTLKHPTRTERRQRRLQMHGFFDARLDGILALKRKRRYDLRSLGLWRSRRRKGGVKHG